MNRLALLILIALMGCKKEPETLAPIETQVPSVKELKNFESASLWLKADSLTLEDGASVTEWTDARGRNLTFSQNNSELKPKFISSGTNSLPAVEFDGFEDHLTSNFELADIANGNSVLLFAVVLARSVSTNHSNPWMNNPIMIDSKGQFGVTLKSNSVQFFNYVHSNSVASLDIALGQPTLISAVLEHDKLKINSAQKASQEIETQNILNLDTNLFLGGSPNGSDYLQGAISEILVFKTLSADQKQDVHNYLMEKYNIK